MTKTARNHYSRSDRRHQRRAARTARILSAERELHLIDIENALGDPRFTAEDVAAFRDSYISQMRPARDAQVVIATSSREGQFEVAAGWPGARTVFRLGRDGADRALISVALEEDVTARYGNVVFTTSDKIFTPTVTALREAGVSVAVVAGRGSVGRALAQAAAGNIHHLDSAVRTLPTNRLPSTQIARMRISDTPT